ncbi:unnamed protein product [Ectocarpus sp. 8 AP-2014]
MGEKIMRRRPRRKSAPLLPKVLAVAKPIMRWGIMPAVLLMGMRSEPNPTLLEVFYPL